MDIKVKNKVAELQRTLEQDEQRISLSDPVAKMMLVAMAHQSCEIERKMDQTVARLSEQFCDQVLQRSNLQAQPAVSVVNIGNGREYAPYYIDENDTFTLIGKITKNLHNFFLGITVKVACRLVGKDNIGIIG